MAREGKTSYSVIETSTLIKTGAGYVKRIIVSYGGTVDILTVFDNTAASGTILFKGNFQAVTATDNCVEIEFECDFYTGLYVAFTGNAGQIDYVNTYYL